MYLYLYHLIGSAMGSADTALGDAAHAMPPSGEGVNQGEWLVCVTSPPVRGRKTDTH
jgi:hypothetical protein